MLAQVFSFFARREQSRRARLADTLLARLDTDNYLAVDKPLLRDLGTTRRELFQVAFGLVAGERMHVLDEAGGRVILMANAEYTRFMARRSTAYETDAARAPVAAVDESKAPDITATAAPLVAGDENDANWIAARQERLDDIAASILASDSDSALFTGATLGGAPLGGLMAAENGAYGHEEAKGYDWFGQSGASGEKVPEKRQTLPPRRRQAWLVAEPAGMEVK